MLDEMGNKITQTRLLFGDGRSEITKRTMKWI